MAEDIAKYGVSLDFKKSLADLKKFRSEIKKLNTLQKSINSNRKAMQSKASTRLYKGQDDNHKLVQNAITKREKDEARKREKIYKTASNRMKAQQKQSNFTSSSRIKQAVGNITAESGASSMSGYYKAEEKAHAKKMNNIHAEANAMNKVRDKVMQSAEMQDRQAKGAKRLYQENVKIGLKQAQSVKAMKQMLVTENRLLKSTKKRSFLMDRMNQSSRQMAGNLASAFAVAGTAKFITTTGQAFESVDNTMLSVSKDAKDAAQNIKFVRGEAFRLGLGLKDSAKGYAKLVAARGDLTIDQTKGIFTGVSEMSTLLGLSAEESSRAINAIMQMASKGNVTAEELKLQLGEVMPSAISEMAMAAKDAGLTIKGTVKEMLALQQTGGLISSKVLPHFAERLHTAAINNDGLKNALNSNRVAMNRMATSAQVAAEIIFKSGWGGGLTELFNEVALMLKENEVGFKAFGKVMKVVFKSISDLVKYVLSPAFGALSSILNGIVELFGDVGLQVGIMGFAFVKAVSAVKALGMAFSFLGVGISASTWQITGFVLALASALAMAEELAEYITPSGKKTLFKSDIYDIAATLPEGLQPANTTARGGDRRSGLDAIADLSTKGGFLGSIISAGLVGTSYLKNFTSSSSEPIQVQVESTIVADGEVLGRVSSNSEAGKSAMNRAIHDHAAFNY